MGQHNTSQDVQNRFTAYLQIALKRRKRDYQRKQICAKGREVLTDFQNTEYEDCHAYGAPDWPRYTGNSTLLEALACLTERERRVLFARILDGIGYDELPDSMDLRYGAAASIYRRAVQKLKKAMKGEL